MDFKGIVYLYLRYLNNPLSATGIPRAETARYPAKQSRRQCHLRGRRTARYPSKPQRKERGRSSGRGIRSGAKKSRGADAPGF